VFAPSSPLRAAGLSSGVNPTKGPWRWITSRSLQTKQGGNDEKILRYYSGFDDHIDVPRLCIGTGDVGTENRIDGSCFYGGKQAFRWG